MAGAAILIGLLFWRFEEVQRTADLLATEQRTLRQSEERFRSLVKNASDVIVIVDEQGKIHYQSPATERVWGYAPEALSGNTMWGFVHGNDLARAQSIFADLAGAPG